MGRPGTGRRSSAAACARAGAIGLPLRQPGVAHPALVRLPQALLPHQHALAHRTGRQHTDAEPEKTPRSLRAAPVPRRDGSNQLRGYQPRRHSPRDSEQWREPGAGFQAPERGRLARAHLHERRERLRSRPQHSRDTRGRCLPQPDHRAHPVRASHCAGVRPSSVHRAAVHQQVLHPGSAAGEFVRALCTRSGHPGIRRLLAQRAA